GGVFDQQRTPEELLAEGARQARVSRPVAAAVFSMEAVASETPLVFSTAPKPVLGPAVRPPGVAGRFYPGDPGELGRMVDRLLEGERREETWPAARVPHAGLIYSGRIAGAAPRRPRLPETIIIPGPQHARLG